MAIHPSRLSERYTSALFAGMVLVFCVWALSLPLFPTQDGPMHKYYVHVLASLLNGSQDYRAYTIRHPFPPYATHYAVLLGLTRFLSFDLAEKLLVCLIFICTAYSVRYCARSIGANGGPFSLCAVPLVVHWSLVMGFFNYSLAVGLFFLAAGLWIRAAESFSARWIGFAAVTLLLACTHPIPLLLLIVFCSLDLLIRVFQGRHTFSFKTYQWLCAGWLLTVMAFLFPLASVDRSRSAANLQGFGLHKDALLSSLALFGISPFDTRSRNLLINGYRLGLILLLIGSFLLAASGFVGRLRAKQLRPSDTMALLALCILFAIPVLPSAMNGSDYFATRLMVIPWLGALVAASGEEPPRRVVRAVPFFAAYLMFVTLLPAELFFRPVALQLSSLERQSLPTHSEGLALLDPAMLKAVRVEHQMGFNPYLWSGALPFLGANAVLLNSPFMDQKITPLMPVPGGELLIDQMRSPEEAERLINGNVDLPALPRTVRNTLLASTREIVFIGTPADVARGLSAAMDSKEAGLFDCAGFHWYLVCSARSGSDDGSK